MVVRSFSHIIPAGYRAGLDGVFTTPLERHPGDTRRLVLSRPAAAYFRRRVTEEQDLGMAYGPRLYLALNRAATFPLIQFSWLERSATRPPFPHCAAYRPV